MGYAQLFNERETPQSEPLAGRDQVRNHAGGYTFRLDKWGYLERFLVLGTEKPTYYANAKDMTFRATSNVLECIRADGHRVVDIVTEISQKGVAPKNDPALFVLALCVTPEYANVATRRYAAAALPLVARTATHLFRFVDEASSMRGWGNILVNAVNNWYRAKYNQGSLGYQVAKYKSRHGWTHRDLIRMSHLTSRDNEFRAIIDYAVHGLYELEHESFRDLPDIIRGAEIVKSPHIEVGRAALAIKDFRLTHEMVPNDLKKHPEIWAALLENMPVMAMVRNLGVMTARGLVTQGNNASRFITNVLTDRECVSSSRMHPIFLLNALNTYRSGSGLRGSLQWSPARNVVDALEDAFFASFDMVEPSGKNILLALDSSGSMGASMEYSGLLMNAREAAAVMALVTAKSERNFDAMTFTSSSRGFRHPAAERFDLSRHDSLEHVTQKMMNVNFGGTDCALPMIWAQEQKLDFDTIVLYTDNETWAGNVHPIQALKNYRQYVGHPVKLVIVGLTSTGFSIADPLDAHCLDVVGFDTRAPSVISSFAAR